MEHQLRAEPPGAATRKAQFKDKLTDVQHRADIPCLKTEFQLEDVKDQANLEQSVIPIFQGRNPLSNYYMQQLR